jgi:hypothetical protein
VLHGEGFLHVSQVLGLSDRKPRSGRRVHLREREVLPQECVVVVEDSRDERIAPNLHGQKFPAY